QERTTVTFGYDTIRYHALSGPLDGTSLLLEPSLSVQPFDDEDYSMVQLDAQRYFQIYGRVKFCLRGGVGTSVGGKLARRFFLYSFDTIRGAEFQDANFLLGRDYMYSTA